MQPILLRNVSYFRVKQNIRCEKCYWNGARTECEFTMSHPETLPEDTFFLILFVWEVEAEGKPRLQEHLNDDDSVFHLYLLYCINYRQEMLHRILK